MNPIAQAFFAFVIAIGKVLLVKESPFIVAVGDGLLTLGENALSSLTDSTIPLEQKKLDWKTDLDAVKAAAQKCEDQLPSIVTNLISSAEQIAFEELL